MGLLIVGVLRPSAFRPLRVGNLMSLLIVGVLRPSAFRPLRVGNLMSKLMGFLLGRGIRPGGLLPPPPRTSHEQARGRPRRRPLPIPLKTMGGVLAVCDGRR